MNTTNTTQDVKTQEGVWVEIARITVPEDARKHTPEDIDSRAVSLAKEGQLENILLSKEGDKLVLVYGNGRLESAKKAGWEKIRADIKEGLSETQKLMMTLAENEEREDASPFYTASLHKRLMVAENLTQEQLANQLGKSLRVVEGFASLAKVPAEVSQTRSALRVSIRQALEIAKLTKLDDQLMVLDECANDDLAGKALEKRVKQLLASQGNGAAEPVKPPKEESLFQFSWKKDANLQIRAQYSPEKPLDGYFEELRTALEEFLTKPHKKAAVQEEVRAAA